MFDDEWSIISCCCWSFEGPFGLGVPRQPTATTTATWVVVGEGNDIIIIIVVVVVWKCLDRVWNGFG